ncbi:MAG: glycosyltransferase family 39 protein [Phenylobacterium sp.]|uniref:glycosyltransferase family 39 protein n=1 Tax=Phenylobacterium sp. TaxID=1871053 RepID=UPI00391C1A6A
MAAAIADFLDRRTPGGLLALALLLALAARLAALALFGDISPGVQIWEYGEQAQCAYRNGSDLCLRYPDESGGAYPSAYMPPLLSYLWLVLFHLFGDGSTARALFLAVNLALGVANVWLVFRLALALRLSRWAAFLAAGLMAVYPTFVFVTATYHHTNLAVFLLLAIVLVAARIARRERVAWRDAALGGALCGLAALNRSEMLIAGPALLGLGALWRRSLADVFRVGMVGALAMAVILAPWVVRNYLLFERVIPVAQSTGYNLWKGFNPYTNGSGNMTEEPPDGPGDAARDRIALSVPTGPRFETDLQDAYMAEFEAYMAEVPPGRLLELSLNKVLLLWGFDWTDRDVTGGIAYRLPWVVANLLALVGLVVLWRERRKLDGAVVALGLAALFLLTLAYVATAVHARYRMHIEPFLFVLAGAGAQALLAWLGVRFGGSGGAVRQPTS